MAYVYGKTKSRAVLAAAVLAQPPAAIEEPLTEAPAQPKPSKRGKTPGRKRGPGKNNKHGSGCGTNNGYWAHKRAGEDACDDCLKARRDYNNAFKKVAKARRAA